MSGPQTITPFAATASYPASPFGAATVSLTNGSPNILFSVAQSLKAGSPLVFSAQPGVAYTIAADTNSSTAATLTTNYTGTTDSGHGFAFPWSSQPTKVAPAYGFFTPGQAPTAQELDSILNTRDVAANANALWSGTAPAQNWQAGISNPTLLASSRVSCAAYDAVNDQWLIGMGQGSGTQAAVAACNGRGSDLALIAPAFNVVNAKVASILKDPTDATTFYLMAVEAAVDTVTMKLDMTAGSPAWTAVDTQLSVDGKLAYFNGVLIAAYAGAPGTGTPFYGIRTSVNKGASWVTSYTSTHTPRWWNVRAGSNEVLVLACQASSTPFLARSTNGTTWAEVALTGIPSGDTPADIVNLGGSNWLMVVQSGTAGCYFRQSLDGGLTWATISTLNTIEVMNILPTTVQVLPILCSFGQLVACLVNPGDSTLQAMFSADGGATWRRAIQAKLTGGGGVAMGLSQSDCQLLLLQGGTQALQFSAAAGVPSHALT